MIINHDLTIYPGATKKVVTSDCARLPTLIHQAQKSLLKPLRRISTQNHVYFQLPDDATPRSMPLIEDQLDWSKEAYRYTHDAYAFFILVLKYSISNIAQKLGVQSTKDFGEWDGAAKCLQSEPFPKHNKSSPIWRLASHLFPIKCSVTHRMRFAYLRYVEQLNSNSHRTGGSRVNAPV